MLIIIIICRPVGVTGARNFINEETVWMLFLMADEKLPCTTDF